LYDRLSSNIDKREVADMAARTLSDTSNDQKSSLEKSLRQITHDINVDKFMLMEYLRPVVDGCRAALNISIEKAQTLHQISDDEFESYMTSTTDSFQDIGICFKTSDTGEEFMFTFEHGRAKIFDGCIEPDVVITADEATLQGVLDSDPNLVPPDLLGTKIHIAGADPQDVVEGLGLLCYPSLLRIARSGIDPSSILSEDADTVIMATASDLVTKMIRKWIDIQLQAES